MNKLSCTPRFVASTPRHRPVQLRFASTVTPKSSTQTDRHVPPPSPHKGKKIELKPAPVKPAALRPATSSPPPSPNSPSYYRPPRHHTLPQPLESSLNALALAKQDIVSAAEQGVLLPPRKDATPLKRFLHQALQLLVRPSPLVRSKLTPSPEILLYGSRRDQYPPQTGPRDPRTRQIRGRTTLARRAALHRHFSPRRAQVRRLFVSWPRSPVCRLVPFLLIILVAEELVPLVALYAPRMLPSTCVLPGQRDRILSRARNQQVTALFHYRNVFEAMSNEGLKTGFFAIEDVGDPGAVCR